MLRLRFLQGCECLLAISLLIGFFEGRRGPYLPVIVGVTMNLLCQYGNIRAIRQQRLNLHTGTPRNRIPRIVLLPNIVLVGLLSIVVTLNVKGLISGRVFGLTILVGMVAAALATVALSRKASRLRNAQGR